jgi:ubiquinol-cytochrome c reductase cytochrome b subunit
MSAHGSDEGMWTARLRGTAVRSFPPDKLLPDRQPSYVASWIYVFGVLTLAGLAVVIASGLVLVVKGPSWWQVSSVGLFVNSLHLWSVELFFFFMVIHLWGKFAMAAWRGRRRATWVTGVIAFVTSVGAAFTGYLSQQNFDTQWIATQGKDGLNAVGIGAEFNILNFGQMLIWHVLLVPLILSFLVAVHVLLVRRRGVVHPLSPPGQRRGAPVAVSQIAAPAAVTPDPVSVGDATAGGVQ